MSILRESYLYHLWAVLCTVYYDSAVHRCLVRMAPGATARSTRAVFSGSCAGRALRPGPGRRASSAGC